MVNDVYEWQIFEEGKKNEMLFSTTTKENLPDDFSIDVCIEETREEDVHPIEVEEEKPVEEIKVIRYTGRDNHAEEILLPCYFDDPAIQKLFEDFIRQRREMGYKDIEERNQIFVVQLSQLTREQQMAALLDALWYRRDALCIQNVTEEETEW